MKLNKQKNRMIYVLSNFLYAISVSIIYAWNGIVLLVIVSKLGIPGDLGLDFIVAIVVNTILLVLFYFLFIQIEKWLGIWYFSSFTTLYP